jgi:hypothetical protein
MRALKRSHAVPRDFFSYCLKIRTSERRLTTLEMRKKYKKKARAQGFPISLSTPYSELVPTFSFSHQRERKELPS